VSPNLNNPVGERCRQGVGDRVRYLPKRTTMTTCPNCNASVADDLAWCNQCYAALARPAEASPAPAEDERPLWVRTGIATSRLETHTEFSRWRGGATSFGPIGRILLTIGVLLLLAIGYPILRGLIFSFGGMDVPGVGFMIMYAVVAVPSGLYLLSRVWKRERVA